MNAVHCKTPTRRQVKAEISRRVEKNPKSGPHRRAILLNQIHAMRHAWRRFERIYREALPDVSPQAIDVERQWRNRVSPYDNDPHWTSEAGDAMFRSGALARLRNRFKIADDPQDLLEAIAHGQAFYRWRMNRDMVMTMADLYVTDEQQASPEFQEMSEEYEIDPGLFAQWGLKRLGSQQPIREAHNLTAPEHPNDPAAQPDDRYVPVLLSLVVGVVTACMIYWKYH